MTSLHLESLTVQGLLSFGAEPVTVDWRPLNVLIGPNASGKSNLIDIFGLLHQLPSDLEQVFRAGAGVRDWLWRGSRDVGRESGGERQLDAHGSSVGSEREADGRIEVRFRADAEGPDQSLSHAFRLGVEDKRALVWDERLDRSGTGWPLEDRMQVHQFALQGSGMAYRIDAKQWPWEAALQSYYRDIAVYRGWSLGRDSLVRATQRTDQPTEVLSPSFANLALVLRRLCMNAPLAQELRRQMQNVYPGLCEIITATSGLQDEYVDIYIRESGLVGATPASRLSDGTLRYLALLALLLDPTPPPLICLEEPEIGLHPDLIHVVARLLVEASERTQIILTTHSEQLVGALSHQPEAVLVCERGPGGTQVRRLDGAQLRGWLDQYTLGELWRMGEIGGTRW